MTRPIVISAKQCPECRRMIELQALECSRCGHVFQTHSAELSNRTQVFDAILLPRMPDTPPSSPPLLPARRSAPVPSFKQSFMPSFGQTLIGSGFLVVMLGAGGWLVWNAGLIRMRPPAASATYAALHAPQTAEGLYEKITIPMSLYELDQTAGGTGRVIHSSDPNTLNLAYDFPQQSVRVSLARVDAASADYRVQTVALYRGKARLRLR